MSVTRKSWRENQLRKYPIKREQIPKLSYDDPKVDELIAQNEPVVIIGSELVSSANKWDLDYLEKSMVGTCTVVLSRNHNFKYYDEKKLNSSIYKNFIPTTRRTKMKFSEFSSRFRAWKNGEERVYMQQPVDNTVGLDVVKDFTKFNWRWVTDKQRKHNWGPLTSNLLLLGMEGNVTPCHYDEQQNFYCQVKGYKRFILFRPSQFECLYPHPVHHPCDRQSQVDFENPDYNKFPKFKNITGLETVLEPGEVLYIPIYWFHHVESLLRGGCTISVNFWYKAGPTSSIVYPLQDHQKVAIMRNVEKMLGEVLHDPTEIAPLLRTLVSGRYN